jgi:hypothetical protein
VAEKEELKKRPPAELLRDLEFFRKMQVLVMLKDLKLLPPASKKAASEAKLGVREGERKDGEKKDAGR